MSGQVLYRKWRPPSFADIVGQGPVTQTLAQAVATNRTAWVIFSRQQNTTPSRLCIT